MGGGAGSAGRIRSPQVASVSGDACLCVPACAGGNVKKTAISHRVLCLWRSTLDFATLGFAALLGASGVQSVGASRNLALSISISRRFWGLCFGRSTSCSSRMASGGRCCGQSAPFAVTLAHNSCVSQGHWPIGSASALLAGLHRWVVGFALYACGLSVALGAGARASLADGPSAFSAGRGQRWHAPQRAACGS